jgi:hypothetical protein
MRNLVASDISFLIAALFTASCPMAIGRAVRQIVVNSIYAVLRTRAHSQIVQEVNKRPTQGRIPSITNRYAATTVGRPASILRVITTLQHSLPARKLMSSPHPMLALPSYPLMSSDAPATLGVAISKITSTRHSFITTLTPANPLRISTNNMGFSLYNQVPEVLTDQVIFPHRFIIPHGTVERILA